MQPYFIPYIGTFQLINKVDKYIFYDDAQYRKGGFINRNTVIVDGKEKYISIPLKKASSNKKINEIQPLENFHWVSKKLKEYYRHEVYFSDLQSILENFGEIRTDNIGNFNADVIMKISANLGITCDFSYSSSINYVANVDAEDKVLSILDKIHATTYVNPVGGRKLYNQEKFASKNIKLQFFEPETFSSGFYSIFHGIALNGIEYVKNIITHGKVIS